MKYKPWVGQVHDAWGGANKSGVEIQRAWQSYCESLASSGERIPNILRREVDMYVQHRRECEANAGVSGGEPAANGATDGAGEDQQNDPSNAEWTDLCDPADNDFLFNQEQFESPDETVIRWDKDHDWSALEHSYPEDTGCLNVLQEKWDHLLKDGVEQAARRRILRSELNEQQKHAHDVIVRAATLPPMQSSTDGGSDIGRLICVLGQGGSGKSHVADGVLTTLRESHGWGTTDFAVFATTGKAATVLDASTLHSCRTGLGLPVGKKVFAKLSSGLLQIFQERFKTLKLVLLDEFSMLRQQELHYVDHRLRQIMGSNKLFGGVTVVLIGDPAQLPPVKGKCLWDAKPSTEHEKIGHGLWKCFDTVVQLKINRRLDRNDPDAVAFNDFLMALRDGKNTEADLENVRKHCSRYTMGMDKWRRIGFDGEDVTHLYTTNKDVHKHNAKCLMELGKPVAFVRAEHTGDGAKYSSDTAEGLDSGLHLAVGAKVLMTSNMCPSAGLCNGSTGEVRDIVYAPGKSAPDLPAVVWVDFKDQYKGESFFPDTEDMVDRKGWVPVQPKRAVWWTPKRNAKGYDEHSCTMLPLKLCWAWKNLEGSRSNHGGQGCS